MNVFKYFFLNSIDYYKYLSYVLALMLTNYLIDQEIKLFKNVIFKNTINYNILTILSLLQDIIFQY